MRRDDILREILSEPQLMEKYRISTTELKKITTSPPYSKKIVEVLSMIINDDDNNLSPNQIYKKIKNTHKL